MGLQRLLAPEPGALFRLLRPDPPAGLAARGRPATRRSAQSTEEFPLVLDDLAALVERIKLLQEEIAAKLNEQTNRTLFTLTLVTVLALPINIVAGFFGMNVGGIPLADHPHGFWVLVAVVGQLLGAGRAVGVPQADRVTRTTQIHAIAMGRAYDIWPLSRCRT